LLLAFRVISRRTARRRAGVFHLWLGGIHSLVVAVALFVVVILTLVLILRVSFVLDSNLGEMKKRAMESKAAECGGECV